MYGPDAVISSDAHQMPGATRAVGPGFVNSATRVWALCADCQRLKHHICSFAPIVLFLDGEQSGGASIVQTADS